MLEHRNQTHENLLFLLDSNTGKSHYTLIKIYQNYLHHGQNNSIKFKPHYKKDKENIRLVNRKGYFCNEYMDARDKLKDTQLPAPSNFKVN